MLTINGNSPRTGNNTIRIVRIILARCRSLEKRRPAAFYLLTCDTTPVILRLRGICPPVLRRNIFKSQSPNGDPTAGKRLLKTFLLRSCSQFHFRCRRGFPPVAGVGWLRKARENVPSFPYAEEGGHLSPVILRIPSSVILRIPSPVIPRIPSSVIPRIPSPVIPSGARNLLPTLRNGHNASALNAFSLHYASQCPAPSSHFCATSL